MLHGTVFDAVGTTNVLHYHDCFMCMCSACNVCTPTTTTTTTTTTTQPRPPSPNHPGFTLNRIVGHKFLAPQFHVVVPFTAKLSDLFVHNTQRNANHQSDNEHRHQ